MQIYKSFSMYLCGRIISGVMIQPAGRISSQRDNIAEEVVEKHNKWKDKAFENKQLFVSFIVLGVFYIG